MLLKFIINKGPLFELELDKEMIEEDRRNIERLTNWHKQDSYCKIVNQETVQAKQIEETNAKGVHLQWLTPDELELSPDFCIRRIRIEPGGYTPPRQHDWEHQLVILSGKGKLYERNLVTKLTPGKVVLVRSGLWFQVVAAPDSEIIYLDIIPSITQYFGR